MLIRAPQHVAPDPPVRRVRASERMRDAVACRIAYRPSSTPCGAPEIEVRGTGGPPVETVPHLPYATSIDPRRGPKHHVSSSTASKPGRDDHLVTLGGLEDCRGPLPGQRSCGSAITASRLSAAASMPPASRGAIASAGRHDPSGCAVAGRRVQACLRSERGRCPSAVTPHAGRRRRWRFSAARCTLAFAQNLPFVFRAQTAHLGHPLRHCDQLESMLASH
jgi:hypothetical protein